MIKTLITLWILSLMAGNSGGADVPPPANVQAAEFEAVCEAEETYAEVSAESGAAYEDSASDFSEETPKESERKIYIYKGRYYITGYDICRKCCGKTDGITASGAKASVGRTIAAPKSFPFGTVLYIEGIGERVVEDRGGSVKKQRLDVLCSNHGECYALTGWYDVYEVVQ